MGFLSRNGNWKQNEPCRQNTCLWVFYQGRYTSEAGFLKLTTLLVSVSLKFKT